MGFRWLLGFSQVARGLRDHFAITVADPWVSCALSVAFMFLLFTFLFSVLKGIPNPCRRSA